MTDPAQTIHPDFNASDADLVILSADNIQFHLHKKYLESNTGAFPGPGDVVVKSNPAGDTTQLTEPARVLEILFQFIYPKKHPTLVDVPYDILGPLSEAVEKYEVFSAMFACALQLRRFIPLYGPDIHAHAIRHNYPLLTDEVALYLLRGFTPLSTIVEKLPPIAIVPWAIINFESAKYSCNTSFACKGCDLYGSIIGGWKFKSGRFASKMPTLSDFLVVFLHKYQYSFFS
ncbi:hypothetical protein CPB84DRAFT_1744576 [Gymnopilus junonius]|uniref:BTB domain-containing protein n=1 Tax=Gymnopilus junonius TaxID=109634 RepID=A0A9P5NWG1_GYMJU|nr:hypothetical protein CPB84DRAFT_1744576 [Gymnopilus junonius]